MATREYWERIPDQLTANLKVLGKADEDSLDTAELALKIFPESFDKNGTALEIGCGTGRFLPLAALHFRTVIGIDYSWPLLLLAMQRIYRLPGTFVMHGTGTSLIVGDEMVEFVYSVTCFQHMDTIEVVRANIAEAFRILAPKGRVVIQTVIGNPEEKGRYDGTVFRSGAEFAEEFKNAGFEIDECDIEGEWIWLRAHKPVA
jgi:SAM-dependent methyltransferase